MNSWKYWENPKHKAWALLAPRASNSAQPSPLTASTENTGHLEIINPEQLHPWQLMGTKAMGDTVPSLSLQPPSLGTRSRPRGESFGFIVTSLPLPALRVGWKGPSCFTPPDDGCIPQRDEAWGGFPLPRALEERTAPGLTQFCRDSPCLRASSPRGIREGPGICSHSPTTALWVPLSSQMHPESAQSPGKVGRRSAGAAGVSPQAPAPELRELRDISISPS